MARHDPAPTTAAGAGPAGPGRFFDRRRVGSILLGIVVIAAYGYFKFRDAFVPRANAQQVVGIWENTSGDVDTILTIYVDGRFERHHPGTVAEAVQFMSLPPRGRWAIDAQGIMNFRAGPGGSTTTSCEPRRSGDTLLLVDTVGSRKVARFTRKTR
jgi:hypothetical protein